MKADISSRDRAIITKIIHYCDEVAATHKEFSENKTLFLDKDKGFIYRNAVTMPILQIGELVKNFSPEFTSEYADMPWKLIAGMRDVFAHRYGSIDYDVAWNTSKTDIPNLKNYPNKII